MNMKLNITFYRKKLNLSVKQLSEKSKVEYINLWKMENNNYDAYSFSKLERIAKVLGVKPTSLIVNDW